MVSDAVIDWPAASAVMQEWAMWAVMVLLGAVVLVWSIGWLRSVFEGLFS